MARDLSSGKHLCENCGSKINSPDFHNGGIIVKERFCSKRCMNEWNKEYSGNNQSSSGSDNVGSNAASAGAGAAIASALLSKKEKSQSEIEADAETAKAEAEASVQRAKINAETEVRKEELKLEKKKLIAEKAKELRAEGKNFQAFFVEHKKLVIIGGIILLVIIGNVIDFAGQANLEDLDTELSKKADKIEILISTGDKTGALELVQQLYHESTDTKGRNDSTYMSYSYKEYWDDKRESLKKQILEME